MKVEAEAKLCSFSSPSPSSPYPFGCGCYSVVQEKGSPGGDSLSSQKAVWSQGSPFASLGLIYSSLILKVSEVE